MSTFFLDSRGKRMDAINSFSNSGRALISSSAGSGVIVGVVGLILFTVALYVIYTYLVTSLVTVAVLDGTYHARTAPRTVGADKLPKLNGREMSLSFWFYVEELGPTQNFKQVLMIGESLDSAILYVAIDKTSNALYVISRTSTTSTQKPLEDLQNYLNKSYVGPMSHSISVVNYVPLLRWVCLTIVYDYDIVSLYVDGDLYSVTSLDRNAGNNVSSVLSEPKGSLSVGSTARGFNGYVSKVTVASYAQSVWTIKALYQRGPVSGNWLTSSLGLSNYRLQWPITKAKET
jgi:hypothetical protein